MGRGLSTGQREILKLLEAAAQPLTLEEIQRASGGKYVISKFTGRPFLRGGFNRESLGRSLNRLRRRGLVVHFPHRRWMAVTTPELQDAKRREAKALLRHYEREARQLDRRINEAMFLAY